MTCHPNNADFLLVTQEKDYTPPSATPSSATSHQKDEQDPDYDYEQHHKEKEEKEKQQEHQEVNPRRKRRAAVDENVVDPFKPTAEIVRLTYHLTNYYANNLFNSCKWVIKWIKKSFALKELKNKKKQ